MWRLSAIGLVAISRHERTFQKNMESQSCRAIAGEFVAGRGTAEFRPTLRAPAIDEPRFALVRFVTLGLAHRPISAAGFAMSGVLIALMLVRNRTRRVSYSATTKA
jgi:hypothetical protein